VFRSIRVRFIFWYTLILAATFVVFSLTLYGNVATSLHANLDNVLVSKTEGIASSIDTYWDTEKLDAIKDGASQDVFSKINNRNFAKIAKRWVDERTTDAELLNIMVQIYTPEGHLIASSRNSPSVRELDKTTLDRLAAGGNCFGWQNIGSGEGQIFLRVLYAPVKENGSIAYIVRVASRQDDLTLALSRLRFMLFFLLPLTVLITSILAGEFLASITLKPLKSMNRTARQISADNIALRMDVPETHDEIQELAETFNAMLDKINRAISSQQQFIQDISHEMRTPLTILRGELEVALRRGRQPEEYEGILRSNLEEINKLARILEELLVMARLDSLEAGLDLEPLDLGELVKDCVIDIEMLARPKGISVVFNGEEGLMISAEAAKLRRVFVNLLSNAIKYTSGCGQVWVRLDRAGDQAQVVVADSGIGIAPENLPQIFDRFFRVDQARGSDGFGLGLSISRAIVNAHGGAIEVVSELGSGTAFTVRLPLIQLEQPDLCMVKAF